MIGRIRELSPDLLDARQLPEARHLLCLLATFADAAIPYELLLDPASLAASPLFAGITGSRLWQALRALDGVGLIDLIPATWWRPCCGYTVPITRTPWRPGATLPGRWPGSETGPGPRRNGPDPLDTVADMRNFLARYLEQMDSPRDER